MQGWPSLGENIVYLIWKKSSKQLAIIKFNHEKLQLGCLLLSAIKFKDMGKQLASLLKEYFVVLQVTYRTHDPPPPNLKISFIRNSPNTTINKTAKKFLII